MLCYRFRFLTRVWYVCWTYALVMVRKCVTLDAKTFLRFRSCHAHCHAPFQAAAVMLLPGEVTTTAWLPTCHVISARQCSYPVIALSGMHLP